MKAKISIIKILITTVAIIVVIGLISFFAIPKYVENSIAQEFAKRGIQAKYELEWNFPGVILKNAEIQYKGVLITSPKISILYDLESFLSVVIESGEITGKVENSTEDSNNSSSKSIQIIASNIKVSDFIYKGKELSGYIEYVGFINGNKLADFVDLSIPKDLPNTTLRGVHVRNYDIIVDEFSSSDSLDIIKSKLIKKDESAKVSGNGSRYSGIIRKASYLTNEVKIEAKDISYDGKIVASQVAVDFSEKHFSFTGLSFLISEGYTLEAKTLSTEDNKISRGGIEIEGFRVNVNKSKDGFDINLKIGNLISSGSIVLDSNHIKHAKWVLPENSCQTVIDSLPKSLRTSLEGFIFEGTISASIDIDFKEPKAKVKLNNKCKSIKYPEAFSRKSLKSEFSRYVINSSGKQTLVNSGPISGDWVSYGAVSKFLPAAVIACEDMGFYGHKGIHIEAIENSIALNIKNMKFSRGGSTISMQTAKNLWLNREKTISRKIQEAFLTTHLESIMSKEEIVELYMNIVEFSPGSYGIRKAAHHYFKSSASNLSLGQSILIALQLPNPRSVSWNESGFLGENKQAYIMQIITNMEKKGMISPEEMADGLQEEIVIGQAKKSKDYSEAVIPNGQEW